MKLVFYILIYQISNANQIKENNNNGAHLLFTQNNSYNNNSCYSDEEINKRFNNLNSYKIIFTDNLVKINDYKKPFTSFIHGISNAF